MPIPKSKANLKDPKINQAQIAAGQRKIDFLKKWNSNHDKGFAKTGLSGIRGKLASRCGVRAAKA